MHYWHSICSSNPHPGLTPFELIQIDSDWLTAQLSRLGLSSSSRWCMNAGIHRLLALDSLLYSISSLQGRPHLNFSRSTPIDSLLGSVDSSRRVHCDLCRTLGYVHYWLSIRCSTSPHPHPPPPPPARLTPCDHLQINSDWLAGRLCVFCSSSTLSRCKDAGVHPSLTFNSLFFLLFLFLLLFILLLQVSPVSNFCRSALIDSLVSTIDSSRRVHLDGATMLRYIQHWLGNGGVQRYRGNPSYHHTTNYTLYLSMLLLWLTISEIS